MWMMALGTSAGAAELQYVQSTVDLGDCESCSLEMSCPPDTSAVAAAMDGQVGVLWQLEATGTLMTGAGLRRPWHDGATPDVPVVATIGGVCASAEYCFESVTASVPAKVSAAKSVTAWCPSNTYAVSGGFRVDGDPTDVRITYSGPSGLFAPSGWTVVADAEGVPRWGLTTHATCVPFAALPFVEVAQQVDFVHYDTHAAANGTGLYSDALRETAGCQVVTNLKPLPLGVAASVDGSTPMALGSAYFERDWLCSFAHARSVNLDPAYDASAEGVGPLMWMYHVPYLLREEFEGAMACADVPVLEGPWWLGIYADVLFGVVGDGGGVVWLPGTGPVPIDPWGPLYPAGMVTPVAISQVPGEHGDPHRTVATIGAALDQAGVSWVEVGDVAQTLDYGQTVVFVVPQASAARRTTSPEVGAVDWLNAHRAEVDVLDHPTVLFLAEGGPGWTHLAATWNADPGTDEDSADTGAPATPGPAGCGCAGGNLATGWWWAAAVLAVRRRR